MKTINANAPVTCTNSIIINAPAEKVWAVLTGINHWPAWQKEISKACIAGPVEAGATFMWKTGGAGITSTLHTVHPYSQFGWQGKTMGATAIHNWTLVANGQTTKVVVEESMEGWLVVLMKKAFTKNLSKGMLLWLDALKAASEQLNNNQ